MMPSTQQSFLPFHRIASPRDLKPDNACPHLVYSSTGRATRFNYILIAASPSATVPCPPAAGQVAPRPKNKTVNKPLSPMMQAIAVAIELQLPNLKALRREKALARAEKKRKEDEQAQKLENKWYPQGSRLRDKMDFMGDCRKNTIKTALVKWEETLNRAHLALSLKMTQGSMEPQAAAKEPTEELEPPATHLQSPPGIPLRIYRFKQPLARGLPHRPILGYAPVARKHVFSPAAAPAGVA